MSRHPPPLLDAIAWSSVIAIAFYPVHRRLLSSRKTHRPSLSALLSTVLVVVTILMPLRFTALAVNQFLELKDYMDGRSEADST
ncbi:MAG: hypothetical protein ACRD3V_24690 [Vicinamibacteria bacterium]